MVGLPLSTFLVYNSFAVGPALGGTLYQKLGFHAPFVLGIALAVVDLIGRIIVIERRVALQWGVDPWGPTQTASHHSFEMSVTESTIQPTVHRSQTDISRDSTSIQPFPTDTVVDPTLLKVPGTSPDSKQLQQRPKTLSSWGVLWALMRSTRAMVAVVNTFICG
jgi:MFS family permease